MNSNHVFALGWDFFKACACQYTGEISIFIYVITPSCQKGRPGIVGVEGLVVEAVKLLVSRSQEDRYYKDQYEQVSIEREGPQNWLAERKDRATIPHSPSPLNAGTWCQESMSSLKASCRGLQLKAWGKLINMDSLVRIPFHEVSLSRDAVIKTLYMFVTIRRCISTFNFAIWKR